jgi:hypothetical protein
MTAVGSWLENARDALAGEAGVDALELSKDDVEALLELARLAAHESGYRRNAPLVCYLVGLAARSGADVDRLVAAVRRSSS